MVTYKRGQSVDARTRDMLSEAARLSGSPIVVTQGSYSNGSLSAGTHSGGGAADLRTWNMTSGSRKRLVKALRQVGFAAWYRPASSGPWAAHIHAIAIGCDDLAASAQRQVTAYRNGRNGLANNGRDKGPDVGYITWEDYKKSKDSEPEDDPMSTLDAEDKEWLRYTMREIMVNEAPKAFWDHTEENPTSDRRTPTRMSQFVRSIWNATHDIPE